MSQLQSSDIGALLLRAALGVVYLVHSVYLKFFVFTLPGTAAFFGSLGLPSGLAYLTFAVEAIAGTALLLGVRTRIASLALLPFAAGATWAHSGAGWLFTNTGGGWEYPALLTVLLVVQCFVGEGALAWHGSRRRRAVAAGAG